MITHHKGLVLTSVLLCLCLIVNFNFLWGKKEMINLKFFKGYWSKMYININVYNILALRITYYSNVSLENKVFSFCENTCKKFVWKTHWSYSAVEFFPLFLFALTVELVACEVAAEKREIYWYFWQSVGGWSYCNAKVSEGLNYLG